MSENTSIRTLIVAALLMTGGHCHARESQLQTSRENPQASVTRPLAGINLATGGFANDRLPGRYGFDYLYPDATVAAPFIAAGMQAVRLPVLWERLQHKRFGDLDAVELGRVDTMIRSMDGFQLIVLDIHNFGAYYGQRLDGDPALEKAFGDLWQRLAKHYAQSPKVAFGLMNEPNGMSARSARALADIAVAAIREAGATNLILVPGTQWTAAHSWTEGGAESNASAFAGFKDPADHFLFELHDYLDADASGTSPHCANTAVGAERLRAVTAWLRQQHRRAILGEFGASTEQTCLEAMDRMLGFIDANADVWAGWTYWAGGLWWGNYFMNVQPDNGKAHPQMNVLMKHIAPRSATGPSSTRDDR